MNLHHQTEVEVPQVPGFMALGYLIVQTPEIALNSNLYRRHFGLYAGVDRLPPLWSHFGEGPSTLSEGLQHDVDAWQDATFDFEFMPNLMQARHFLSRFRLHGVGVELVFCEVAMDFGEQVEPRHPLFSGPLPILEQMYGLDVSWPSCNHSAILQPGIVPDDPTWKSKLNAFGLLDRYKDATLLREQYLGLFPLPPFYVYRVSKVAELPSRCHDELTTSESDSPQGQR